MCASLIAWRGSQAPLASTNKVAAPIARLVADTNGGNVTALFGAGSVQLVPLRLRSELTDESDFRMTLPATWGYRFAIEVSENLVNWTPVFTNNPADTVFRITDVTGMAKRFYRVRVVP